MTITYPQTDLENYTGTVATIHTNLGDLKVKLFDDLAHNNISVGCLNLQPEQSMFSVFMFDAEKTCKLLNDLGYFGVKSWRYSRWIYTIHLSIELFSLYIYCTACCIRLCMWGCESEHGK